MRGKCERCGQCCEQGYRFSYNVNLIPGKPGLWYNMDSIHIKEFDPLAAPCCMLVYEIDTRLAQCLLQDQKSMVCSGWPFKDEFKVLDNCAFGRD